MQLFPLSKIPSHIKLGHLSPKTMVTLPLIDIAILVHILRAISEAGGKFR
jgi:hypothetical protein